MRAGGLAEGLEGFQLYGADPVGGLSDGGVQLGECGGGEADLVGGGLAVDESRIEGRAQQLLAVLGRDVDEIAEHVVVADLQALDGGVIGVARLHRGDHETGGVAQIARLVEGGVIALADKTAVAFDQRQLLGQRRSDISRCRFHPSTPCEGSWCSGQRP